MKNLFVILSVFMTLELVGASFVKAGIGTAPDLGVVSVEVPSSLSGNNIGTVNLGESVLVQAKIENIGNAEASGYEVDVYLLNGSGKNGATNKKVYSQSYKNSLPINKPIIFKYTIPASKIVEGKNTITVKITDKTIKKDNSDIYPDSNSNNNELSSTIIVNKINTESETKVAIPDLTVDSVTFPDKVFLGTDILVKAKIKDLNNANVKSYKITISVLDGEGNDKIIDASNQNSGTIGNEGITYMFGVEASNFKLGNNAITVRVDDNSGKEVKVGNNSFGRAVLIVDPQQEKEIWKKNRQAAIANLSQEKEYFIRNFKEKFVAEKCSKIENNVQNNITNLGDKKDKHATVYGNLIGRINRLIARFDESKLDTTQIKSEVIELQFKIDKFQEDYAAYAAKMEELKSLTCLRSEGEFRATLLESKALLKIVHTDASDIRTYVKEIIFVDVKALSEQGLIENK